VARVSCSTCTPEEIFDHIYVEPVLALTEKTIYAVFKMLIVFCTVQVDPSYSQETTGIAWDVDAQFFITERSL
jgi:hypothetical protein